MNSITDIDIKKILLQQDIYEQTNKLSDMYSSSVIKDEDVCNKAFEYIIETYQEAQESATILGKDVMTDVEMIKSYTGDVGEKTVFSVLNNLHLRGSQTYLENIVSTPTYDHHILKRRNQTLRNHNLQVTQNLLKQISQYEKDVIWMFEKNTYELDALYDMVYLNFFLINKLNKNSVALTTHNIYRIILSPVIGIVTPISYFIIPYLIIRYKMGLRISFYAYVKMSISMIMSGSMVGGDSFKYVSIIFTAFFYLHGIFNSVEVAKMSYKVASLITNKMNNVMKFIQSAKDLSEQVWSTDAVSAFFKDIPVLVDTNYFKNVSTKPFTILSNFGNQLKLFKEFKPESYKPLYQQVYMLDAINSLVLAKNNLNLCDVTYVEDGEKPVLQITDMRHPYLIKLKGMDDVVCNTIDFKNRNIILTGPNAGGKSTLIKSVIIAILMAQTTTLAAATHCIISPFKYINSQINIPDCKGKESLFEAEMFRSKDNFEMLAKQDGLSFIAMDEIFNSTNPVEGIAGAYAVAKKMSQFDKNLSLISTHYIYLTKLAKEFPEQFVNYKMNVNVIDSDIVYPYKLSSGVSKQYIALELLKKNGFNADIVEDALAIKNSILRSNSDNKNKSEIREV